MQLAPLMELSLQYSSGDVWITPFDGKTITGYGTGVGTASGRLAGEIEWTNAPHRREDGAFLPTMVGVIRADRPVIFRMDGQSIPIDADDTHRRITACLRFEAEPTAGWLNSVLAVAEGTIEVATGAITLTVFECRAEG